MSVTIPLRNDLPYFSLQVSLDDVVYTLTFRWNDRLSAWFMDIGNEDTSVTYSSGLRVVVGYPMAANSAGRLPPGALIFVDMQGTDADPGIDELGQRVQLLYFSVVELGLAESPASLAAAAGGIPVTSGNQTIIYVPGPRGLPGPPGPAGAYIKGTATFDGSSSSVAVVFGVPTGDASYHLMVGIPEVTSHTFPSLKIPESSITASGFTIQASAPFTGRVRWCVLV